jgi:FG-GAP repeat protein
MIALERYLRVLNRRHAPCVLAAMASALAVPTACFAQVVCAPEVKVAASDGTHGDFFSRRLDLSGDTAIVGAFAHDVAGASNQGEAYIFRFDGVTWNQEALLIAPDGAANDNFGIAVAIDGNTAVVGAIQHDGPAGADQGAAYVYERVGGVWVLDVELVVALPEAMGGDRFGNYVVIQNDTIMVSADGRDDLGEFSGAVYVYTRVAGVWSLKAKLLASDGAQFDNFGDVIALDGDTAVIGALFDDGTAGADQGSAYVFVRTGGVWAEQAKLTASVPAANDYFGIWADVKVDTIVVGSRINGAAGVDQGAVYVFNRTGVTWTQDQKLIPSDASGGDLFGDSVSLSGDTLLVGAWWDDELGLTNQGSVYVYSRVGGVFVERGKIVASDAMDGDQFGRVILVEGTRAIISADGDDDLGLNAGSAYFVDVTCTLCPSDLTGDNLVDGADLGLLLGNWGNPGVTDLNGDGTTDGADLVLLLGRWGAC